MRKTVVLCKTSITFMAVAPGEEAVSFVTDGSVPKVNKERKYECKDWSIIK